LEDYARSGGEGAKDGGDATNDNGGDDEDSSRLAITPLEKAVAMTHEMAILELAERNEIDLAYATLRMCSEMMDRALIVNDDGDGADDDDNDNDAIAIAANTVGMMSSRSGDAGRRITALSSLRRSAPTSDNNLSLLLPANYYGITNPSKQRRRDRIAKLLRRHVPEIPSRRLSTLLQQSVK